MDGLKNTREVSFFVLGDDANAEAVHLFEGNYHGGKSISNRGVIELKVAGRSMLAA